MSKNQTKKEQATPNQGPRCTFCGRRSTVRKLEEGLLYCSHCEKMFKA